MPSQLFVKRHAVGWRLDSENIHEIIMKSEKKLNI